jgi:hypothetical protein
MGEKSFQGKEIVKTALGMRPHFKLCLTAGRFSLEYDSGFLVSVYLVIKSLLDIVRSIVYNKR